MNPLNVGILGATGMVGQRFIELLENHPWFNVRVVAASPQSAGKLYANAVENRWEMDRPISKSIGELVVQAVESDVEEIVKQVDFVFCALDMDKEDIKRIESIYAAKGIPVISNNSAHRWTEDVPMIIPEINPEHSGLINIQRKNRGWKEGFIAVKPNCSIQSYVSVLSALREFEPLQVNVVSLQSISGAGKTFTSWPEMIDNAIPHIQGEEEKSEKEPLKIWGSLENDRLTVASMPEISATCIRIPTENGHLASVAVKFRKKPTRSQFVDCLERFSNPLADLQLPSSPKNFIQFFSSDDRPQIKLDRDFENGMGISVGKLQEDCFFDWKFIALSHNTVRGAAGGAILMAELLLKQGYLRKKKL